MKRIVIDAAKCDGCKNCTVACMQAHLADKGNVYTLDLTCMQAHRADKGNVYTLDLTDILNESRNHIVCSSDGSYKPIFCRHCDQPECVMSCMSGANVYTLDLTDILNESRNHIVCSSDGSYKPIFCRHCDQPECVMSCMSGALTKDPETGHVLYYERCAYKRSGNRSCSLR